MITGPPSGGNMGMGMMNPEMMGMMPPHDLAMGFDMPQGLHFTDAMRAWCCAPMWLGHCTSVIAVASLQQQCANVSRMRFNKDLHHEAELTCALQVSAEI